MSISLTVNYTCVSKHLNMFEPLLELYVTFLYMAVVKQNVKVRYESPWEKWVTLFKCLHAAPILLLRIWEVGWQHSVSPLCLPRACVTASIHHPDMGALIETAWLDLVSGWWHICHSTQWGVLASYHPWIICHRSSSSNHTHPISNFIQRIYVSCFNFFMASSGW